MARAKRIKTQASVEAKYSKKIARLLNKYADRTMKELWVELDKLKERMAVELAEFGITNEKKEELNKAE